MSDARWSVDEEVMEKLSLQSESELFLAPLRDV